MIFNRFARAFIEHSWIRGTRRHHLPVFRSWPPQFEHIDFPCLTASRRWNRMENVSYSVSTGGRLTVTFDLKEICTKIKWRNAFTEMVDIQRDGRGAVIDVLPMVDNLISPWARAISDQV